MYVVGGGRGQPHPIVTTRKGFPFIVCDIIFEGRRKGLREGGKERERERENRDREEEISWRKLRALDTACEIKQSRVFVRVRVCLCCCVCFCSVCVRACIVCVSNETQLSKVVSGCAS